MMLLKCILCFKISSTNCVDEIIFLIHNTICLYAFIWKLIFSHITLLNPFLSKPSTLYMQLSNMNCKLIWFIRSFWYGWLFYLCFSPAYCFPALAPLLNVFILECLHGSVFILLKVSSHLTALPHTYVNMFFFREYFDNI